MIHNPKQIEFAENLIIKLFPDQFNRPLANIDRQTVEYLCNNYQNLKFRRILKAVELAWSDKLLPAEYRQTFITTNTRPVIQHVSQPSPIGRLVQPNPAPGSPNPFIPSPQNIGTQAVQINLTPNNNASTNGKAPRAKRSAPSLGPQTCSALFKKRKEQVENSASKNPDRFLIPHQTPHQLTKTKQGSTQNKSPVSNKPTTSISTNKNDKPLSMANLPTGLLQNIEKFTKNSHTNNTAQKMPTPNGISSNGSSTSDDMLTIDINKPGPSGFNSKKSDSNTNSAVVVEQTSKEIQTSKPNSIVCKPTDSSKSPSTAIVGSSVKIPNIMDTIAGGKCISLNTNIPPSLDDIRRALEDDKTPSECEKKNVKSTEKSQPDKAVIDKIIGDRSKSDKSKIDSELQNILNDVNGKLETDVASTDSSSTDSGNETVPSSSSLPPATPDPNKGTKPRKTSEDKEKIAPVGIEISSSIQVLDSDEEDEAQKNRENVKRNIRRVLAETDGVVTIDDSDDDHSSDEKSGRNKRSKSKNNNHKSNSNHLDDLLDTDQENDENDPTDEENEPETEPELEPEPGKSVPKRKRNEIRSFVKSGYDLVKSRSRKKSSDATSSRNKKQKPQTKIVPVTIIPPPTPPRVDEGTPPRQDDQGNFVIKKILKTRRSRDNGTEYKCRYVGFTKDDDEWVTFDAMEGTEKQKQKLIADYEKRKSKKK